MVDLTVLANSYLEHIALAIRVGDNGHIFRSFLDNWAAYRSGGNHVGSGNRPRWLNSPKPWLVRQSAVHDLDFVSVGAAPILARGKAKDRTLRDDFASKNRNVLLVVDHAVPLSALCIKLHEDRIDTPETIEAFLLRWYRRGVLTLAEDDRLRSMGLTKRMPDAHWWNGSPYARYEKAGIKGLSKE